MQPFRNLTGIAVPIDERNVDTDQIIPGRFLMKPRAFDYGTLLFHDLRTRRAPGPAFVLDRPEYRAAQIIVGNANFGCGSAREQAAYALWDYGIRVIIAPSVGDIFRINCIKNGILVGLVPEEVAVDLRRKLRNAPGSTITIDLEQQMIAYGGSVFSRFEIAPHQKEQLLVGQDDITRTMEHEPAIAGFERHYFDTMEWARLT